MTTFQKTKSISKTFVPGVSTFLLMIFLLMLTNPADLPLMLLFAPFLLLFLTIYLLISALLKQLAKTTNNKNHTPIAATIAAIPTLLLILQSIGQSSIPDFIIALLLLGVFVFYFSKSSVLR